MQTGIDILKVLVFPGLLFLLVCGSLLTWLDEKAARLLRGHRPAPREDKPPWRKPEGGRRGSLSLRDERGTDHSDDGRRREAEAGWPQYAGFAVTAALAALGMGGVLLVAAKGDLLPRPCCSPPRRFCLCFCSGERARTGGMLVRPSLSGPLCCAWPSLSL